MFRRSLRTRGEEWLQFFNSERNITYDFIRGIKQVSDYNKLISFLQDSYYEGFNVLKDSEIIKTASIIDELQTHAKIKRKDSKFLGELVELLIYKVEKEKSIEWSPRNIANFFVFLTQQKNVLPNFKQTTIISILAIADKMIDQFYLVDLASLVSSISILLPSLHKTFWERLIIKFEAQGRFDFFDIEGLTYLLKGIFSGQVPKEPSEAFSRGFTSLETELLNKISLLKITEFNTQAILKSLSSAPKAYKSQIIAAVTEKIYENLLQFNLQETSGTFENILKTLKSIEKLTDVDLLKKELFIELNQKIYLNYLIQKDTIFSDASEIVKAEYMRVYLKMAESLNVFQVSLLDNLVMVLHQEINSKFFRMNPSLLSECLSSLAYLNYPGRFSVKIPHKQIQWMAWQTILEKTEDFLMTSSQNTAFQESLEETLEIDTTPSHRNIDFLWALCVFNIYSRLSLPILLSTASIDPKEKYDEHYMLKLFQIHYWLTLENQQEFGLNGDLLTKMKEFKANWDSQDHPIKESSDIKKVVRSALVTEGFIFKENHHDFPYFFDFVHENQKSSIIVDDDEKFLDGSQMQIKNGIQKVMSRQLVNLQWSCKRLSIRNWLNISSTDLLPR